MYVRNGKRSSDNCPYSHLSQDQVKRTLGQGSYEKRDQSRGSDEHDKGSRGRGQGRGKRQQVKAIKFPEASLQVQEAAMLLQLRLLFTN